MSFRLFGIWVLPLMAMAAPVRVESPDSRVQLTLDTDAAGHLVYAVASDGRVRLHPAPAGAKVDGVDLGAGVELGEVSRRGIDETFAWRGNKTSARNRCQVAEVRVRTRTPEGRTVAWVLEARVFDDGAAFRYRIPGAGTRRIAGESTAWELPADATLWFQTSTTSYEEAYRPARADAIPAEETDKKGQKRPVFLGPPATLVYADGTYGLLSEAALRRYSGLSLRPAGGARLAAAFRDDANGWNHEGEIVSPWRVLVLARDLDGLVNSDVIPALCDPPDAGLFPEGMNVPWIKPGKSICTWMVFGNDGGAWEKQKWFVDQCVAIGCEYLLVDGGWQSEKWGWLKGGGDPWARLAELVAYGRERGVGILLWHAYKDNRNDGPGLTTHEARERFLRRCGEAGVAGVKIDFFDAESRALVDVREEILRVAAHHRLAVNFHGVNKPTGEPRTWPNEVTREGIREQEYLLWTELPLPHYGALPFTRMAAGHADFLPGFVRAHYLKNTTLAFQLASIVVYSTPFLCWPDHPEAYLQSAALPLVRSVPVTWDETRVLPGSVLGETVVMARRKGAQWYVAALNCRSEPATVNLDWSRLPGVETAAEMTVYREGDRPVSCRVEERLRAPSERRLAATLPPGGGILVHLNPPPPPPPLKK
ncbi:MAG: glycoside hydrolase family 97 catalytic domain-containing protein [Verrucomicrobia bacterium]|nr:glycoside hydrolase family 97 catalytic domain-containing protein [Verrucomicrobiota bacterium]